MDPNQAPPLTNIKQFNVKDGGFLHPLDCFNLTCYTEGMEITKEQFSKLATKDGVGEIIREETGDLREDVSTLKSPVSTLKEDVSILKQGQRELRDEIQPLRKELTTFKDEILNGQDKIIGELKTIRQGHVAFTGGQKRQDDKLEEHDKRLEQVETKVGIEPTIPY